MIRHILFYLHLATESGTPAITDYLARKGEFTIEDMNNAIQNGYLESLKILLKILKIIPTQDHLNMAYHHQWNIFKYFVEVWNIGTPKDLLRAERAEQSETQRLLEFE